jgi:hypothetical protein
MLCLTVRDLHPTSTIAKSQYPSWAMPLAASLQDRALLPVYGTHLQAQSMRLAPAPQQHPRPLMHHTKPCCRLCLLLLGFCLPGSMQGPWGTPAGGGSRQVLECRQHLHHQAANTQQQLDKCQQMNESYVSLMNSLANPASPVMMLVGHCYPPFVSTPWVSTAPTTHTIIVLSSPVSAPAGTLAPMVQAGPADPATATS